MNQKQSIKVLTSFLLVCLSGGLFTSTVYGHGLVENPPSRNWYCGAITKPDQVRNGVAEYPECGDAFAIDQSAGYQFMSVLSHDVGRAGVTPLPDNVCGFNSESFNDGPTPWDQAADWPTSPMSSGKQDFTWNIQWGPHYDDTEEFRFWITKPGFQYERNRKLGWNDFEDQAFCVENYDDNSPNGNPDVNPLKDTTQFKVSCDVPARQGRHIIYAEWGRNQSTYERFHGCVDVVFDGSAPPPPAEQAEAVFSTDVQTVVGNGEVTLDGSASRGGNLNYSWSVNAPDTSIYSIANPNAAVTTLNLGTPNAAQNVTVTLTVSDANGSSSASDSFMHEPEVSSAWVDLGSLADANYAAGDEVSIRTVDSDGVDTFYPNPALTLDANNASSGLWQMALAQTLQSTNAVAIGVLNNNDQVALSSDNTANRIYAQVNSGAISAFLIHTAEPVEPEPPVEPPVDPEPPIDPPDVRQ